MTELETRMAKGLARRQAGPRFFPLSSAKICRMSKTGLKLTLSPQASGLSSEEFLNNQVTAHLSGPILSHSPWGRVRDSSAVLPFFCPQTHQACSVSEPLLFFAHCLECPLHHLTCLASSQPRGLHNHPAKYFSHFFHSLLLLPIPCQTYQRPKSFCQFTCLSISLTRLVNGIKTKTSGLSTSVFPILGSHIVGF